MRCARARHGRQGPVRVPQPPGNRRGPMHRFIWDRLRSIQAHTAWIARSGLYRHPGGFPPSSIRRRLPSLPESVLPAATRGSASNDSPIVLTIAANGRALLGEAGAGSIALPFEQTRKNPDGSLICRGSVELGMVPRRGLEPPRCYSLVPETSASTNSAIWAHLLQGTNLATRFEFQEREQSYQK